MIPGGISCSRSCVIRADILPDYPGKISGSRIFIVYSGIYITSRTLNPEYLPFTGSISGPVIVSRDIPAFRSREYGPFNIRYPRAFLSILGTFSGNYTVFRGIHSFPGDISRKIYGFPGNFTVSRENLGIYPGNLTLESFIVYVDFPSKF